MTKYRRPDLGQAYRRALKSYCKARKYRVVTEGIHKGPRRGLWRCFNIEQMWKATFHRSLTEAEALSMDRVK